MDSNLGVPAGADGSCLQKFLNIYFIQFVHTKTTTEYFMKTLAASIFGREQPL